MIIRRFLLWSRTAAASDRAAAVRALAQAYLFSDMQADERREAETAMLAMLDDASPMVRRALAETLAGHDAPRALMLGLAQDQADIAAIVLERSPVLSDDDLVDAVAVGSEPAQRAVACRAHVSVAVAAALVEVGAPGAVHDLLNNQGADLALQTLERAAQRHGACPSVRDALLMRDDLPAALRHQMAVEVAQALKLWAGAAGLIAPERAERIARESTEKVAVALAADSARAPHAGQDLVDLVARLRATGRLTPGLMLRSLIVGETALAEAALADLAGIPLAKASGILHDRRGFGVAALCRKAGIPAGLTPAFVAAAEAVREFGAAVTEAQRATRSRRIVERVLVACESGPAAENAALMALLRRFEADAAREEAQAHAQAMADDAALAALREIDPDLTLLEFRPETALKAA